MAFVDQMAALQQALAPARESAANLERFQRDVLAAMEPSRLTLEYIRQAIAAAVPIRALGAEMAAACESLRQNVDGLAARLRGGIAAASLSSSLRASFQQSQTLAYGPLPPLATEARDIEVQRLRQEVRDVRQELHAAERKLAVVEGEVSMVWGVVDWANEGERPADAPEAPPTD